MKAKRGSTIFRSGAIIPIIGALFCVFLVLVALWTPSDIGLRRAVHLYIPIACTGPDFGFKYTIGTGFPVEPDIVMTAKHVNCGEHNITEISYDHGDTWELIQPDHMYASETSDIRIYRSRKRHKMRPAVFRQARLGEQVYGYGVAFNTTSTVGYVTRVDTSGIYSTNAAIGGMSGSALVGRDGSVVGMVVRIYPAFVGHIPTAYASFAIPGPLLSNALLEMRAKILNPPADPHNSPAPNYTLPRLP